MKIPRKNHWYDWLINCIPEIVENIDNIVRLLRTITSENYSKPTYAKSGYKGQKIIKDDRRQNNQQY